MACHSLMQTLEQFRNLGHVYESTYTFRPGPNLQEVVDRFPPGTCLCFLLGDPGMNVLSAVPDTEPGYRIRLGHCRLYLSLGNQVYENKTGIELASHMHLLFMTRRLYYVEEADILGYWENPDDEFNRSEDYAQEKLTVRSVLLQELNVYESTYTFRPCPKLQEVVDRFPPSTCRPSKDFCRSCASRKAMVTGAARARAFADRNARLRAS